MTAVCFAHAQDTFSIVAVDESTGEVGSAGASCVDLFNTPFADDSFLGQLFPGVGAINTQAAYLVANQNTARAQMNGGKTPSEIIDYLVANDAQNSPQIRQYGLVRLDGGTATAAGHTGAQCFDYKSHIAGSNYCIQGNILSGQGVLDSMEARFLRADGDLACRLMAALQGANTVGADTRCEPNGSSSLFAFVKVAQPDDNFGDPSLLLSVRTRSGDMIEPIDSLQKIFDESQQCFTTATTSPTDFNYNIYPNPATQTVHISPSLTQYQSCQLMDTMGKILPAKVSSDRKTIDISELPAGTYTLIISDGSRTQSLQIIKS